MKTSVATPHIIYQKMSTLKKRPSPLHISDVKKSTKTKTNFHHFFGVTADEVEGSGNEENMVFNQFCLVSPHVQLSLS